MKMRPESGSIVETIRGRSFLAVALCTALALLGFTNTPTNVEAATPDVVHPGLAGLIEITPAEEEIAVWVFFADKGELTPDLLRMRLDEAEARLSVRALERRAKTRSLFLVDERDIAVNKFYVQAIEELGVVVRTTSKWLNAVSIDTLASSVDAIAARVGFASRSHFSKAFTEQFGCSPSSYRAQGTSSN